MSKTTYDLELSGCTPTPLAHYLKGLGVLRLVSEQLPESQAKGWWQNDTFWLQSTLDREALVDFFLNQYAPSPIIVPWSGSDFFEVKYPDNIDYTQRWPISSSKTHPKAGPVIESFLYTTTQRLSEYRLVITETLQCMKDLQITEKESLEPQGGNLKPLLLSTLRNKLPENYVKWIDTASVVQDLNKRDIVLNCLLGGGGGSDGNAHFSDNFMQCLWIALNDFDNQRRADIPGVGGLFNTRNALIESLVRKASVGSKINKLSPAMFDSGGIGGPNSGTSFSQDSAYNPWDYILMFEGVMAFSGAASQKLGKHSRKESSFPFTFRHTSAGMASGHDSDKSPMSREFWAPLWNHPSGYDEIETVIASARISLSGRFAENGSDIVRAIADYGVDRGINEFQRFTLLRGRIGGDNYFTACDAGRFGAKGNQVIAELITPIDQWLNRFRSSLSNKSPASAGRALRAIEDAIFRICQRGNTSDVQLLLVALGKAEATIAKSPKLRHGEKGNGLSPLPLLSMDWLVHSKDDTPEFRLAAALSSVWHKEVGPIRKHLEPLDLDAFQRGRPKWLEVGNSPCLVWSSGNLVRNLNAVIQRRIIEVVQLGKQKGESELLAPLQGRYPATLADLNAFINQEVDEQRLENLFRGFILINWKQNIPFTVFPKQNTQDSCSTEGAYLLFKLCHLSRQHQNIQIKLQPQIIARALSGDASGATQLAARRLRNSGIPPAVNQVHCSPDIIRRIAAALMFPISEQSEQQLFEAVFARHLRKTEST